MAIPNNYQCDGQMNLWDYMTASNPESKLKPYEYTFNRFVGQRVEIIIQGETKLGRITSFGPYYTEVETDDGEEYAGTNLNVYPVEESDQNICKYSRHECDKKKRHSDALFEHDIYNCPEVCCRKCDITKCGARCNGSEEPTLPSLEDAVSIVSVRFGLKFEKTTWDWKDENYFEYVAKYKGSTFEIDENTYTGGRLDGERFIGLNWTYKSRGAGRGADSLGNILKFFERRIKETDELIKKGKKKETDDGD